MSEKYGYDEDSDCESVYQEKNHKLLNSPDYKVSCLTALKNFLLPTPLSLQNRKTEGVSFLTFNSSNRLKALRKLMKFNNLSAYIVPSEDEHLSEYTSEKDKRREYISGFTGSAGIAVITTDSAALSTDSRYFLQAQHQLDDNWFLIKQGVKNYPNWIDWLIDECLYLKEHNKEIGNIGIDPKLINFEVGKKLLFKINENNLNFVNDLDYNLIDSIRGRVPSISSPIYEFPLQYSGLDTAGKLGKLRKIMVEDNSFVFISNALDSIAWLLNLRGNDIQFNPVFFSYMIIYLDRAILYVDKNKLTENLKQYLNHFNVDIKNYNEIWDDLPALTRPKGGVAEDICIELNSSYSIYINIPSIYNLKIRSIITELKGIKNVLEIENLKVSQKIDSLAIIKFLSWIEKNKLKPLDELTLAKKLYSFRLESPYFKGNSFSTIIATGSNASIVHYEPDEENNSKIELNKILLIDSGGQYFQGTTDITRTVYLCEDQSPNEELKRNYTLVLKGHLNICMLKFSEGTSSYYIDKLGRLPLLKYGLNYGHGTGHGIDNFLNVHSGPCGLSPSKTSYNYKPLEAGNFISDEPGYYKDGEYGIRIESDILVKKGTGESMLEFDYFTLVPFCNDLIDTKYLTDAEIEFINEYHAKIYETFGKQLEFESYHNTKAWLQKATEPLSKV